MPSGGRPVFALMGVRAQGRSIMGWNTGYRIFEETVVGAYDLGKLDKALLAVLMEPYRGSDIDSGGEQGLESKDGLNVVQIACKVWGVELPVKPDLPKDWDEWTEEQDEANEVYLEARDRAFRQITKHFGWR